MREAHRDFHRFRPPAQPGDLYVNAEASKAQTAALLNYFAGEIDEPVGDFFRLLAAVLHQVRTRDWMEAIGDTPELDPGERARWG